MADIKKFLDSAGVSTLWGQVKAEIAKIPTYDDTQVKADIAANTAAIEAEVTRAKAAEAANAKAVTDLAASVAEDIAEAVAGIVDGADSSYDTLKEIAAWIATHPESVAALNQSIAANATAIEENADAIAALEGLVGETSVAAQIADAISKAGHAAASDLSAAVARIAANETTIAGDDTRLSAVEGKAASNESAISNLGGRLDGIVAQGGEPNVINNIKVNGVIQSIATDKSVDIAVPVLQALTEAEIKAACV